MNEFEGRCPTVDEVNSIPSKDWLAAPGMGPTLLRELDSLTQGLRSKSNVDPTTLSDAELLSLLESLQREMDNLHRDVQSLMSSRPTRRFIRSHPNLH